MTRLWRLLRNLPMYFRVLGWRGVIDFACIRYSSARRLAPLHVRGCAQPLWLRPGTTDFNTFRDVFLAQDYAVDLPASSVSSVIDGGANIGLASIYFAARFPGAQIVAVEPEQGNYELLCRNTAAYPRITAIRAALWGASGPLALFDPGRGEHGFTTGDKAGAGVAIAGVDGVRVGELMRRMGRRSLDLLKLDVEGAEKEIFESSTSWIGRVQTVIVELHERIKPGCEESFHHATRHMAAAATRGPVVCKTARAPGPHAS